MQHVAQAMLCFLAHEQKEIVSSVNHFNYLNLISVQNSICFLKQFIYNVFI